MKPVPLAAKSELQFSEQGIAKGSARMAMPEEPGSRSKWFFTRKEIKSHSPSRRDGISLKKEAQLRRAYSLFLQEVGAKLKVPHLTTATAQMLCHRYYMCQSHANNDWQTVATACILIACKVDDTPHFLNDVALVAYEIAHKHNPSTLLSIRQREFFREQKELIVVAERVLLTTIDFDLNIGLPYMTLVVVLKRLNIPDLANFTKVSWHLVHQWLQTSLCLQYEPQYIAAGSIALAARILEVKLPTEKGKVWWLEIDVAPEQLDEVTMWMHSKLEPLPSKSTSIIHSESLSRNPSDSSSQSCPLSEATDQYSRHTLLVKERGSVESVKSINCQNLAEGYKYATMNVGDSGPEIKAVRGEFENQNSMCKRLKMH